MDHPDPCSTLLFVEHLVLGLFAMLSTLGTAFLVHRRVRADRERHALSCPECRELEQSVTNRHRRGRWSKRNGGP